MIVCENKISLELSVNISNRIITDIAIGGFSVFFGCWITRRGLLGTVEYCDIATTKKARCSFRGSSTLVFLFVSACRARARNRNYNRNCRTVSHREVAGRSASVPVYALMRINWLISVWLRVLERLLRAHDSARVAMDKNSVRRAVRRRTSSYYTSILSTSCTRVVMCNASAVRLLPTTNFLSNASGAHPIVTPSSNTPKIIRDKTCRSLCVRSNSSPRAIN